jgi:hypothetical protein
MANLADDVPDSIFHEALEFIDDLPMDPECRQGITDDFIDSFLDGLFSNGKDNAEDNKRRRDALLTEMPGIEEVSDDPLVRRAFIESLIETEDSAKPPSLKKAKQSRERQQRKPKESLDWWENFLSDEAVHIIQDTEILCPIPPTTSRAAQFRRKFRVPFRLFEELVSLTIEKGWYDPCRTDAAGHPCSDINLLILGALYKLGHNVGDKEIADITHISAETHRVFFQSWCKNMASVKVDCIDTQHRFPLVAKRSLGDVEH